jgi:broad specificity phosphatase PhoE
MLRLILVAHAPTRAQRHLRFPADEGIEPLDPAGTRRLLATFRAVGTLWHGPERRCAETAHLLGLAAAPCPDLQAWSMGDWAGQDVMALAERDPAGFAAWRSDPEARPHGGESLTMLLERVAAWMARQTERAETAERLLVVADPTVIRAAVVHVLDARPQTFWRLDVAPLSITVAQHAMNEWRLRSLGVLARNEPDEPGERAVHDGPDEPNAPRQGDA